MKNGIEFNKKAHDKIVKKYEKIHTEIYNDIEQTRLADNLKEALSLVQVGNRPRALDVGCGAGNLTQYLSEYGCKIVAADVSAGFLKYIHTRFPGVETHELNGEDLSVFADESFDIVATYSVLHHIPDYLHMVEEMCRVLKSGGILYIDHERNEDFWNNDPRLLEFYRKQRYADLHLKVVRKLKNFTSLNWYVNKLRTHKDPKYQEEGDIHVWPDDYVEWTKVKEVAKKQGLSVASEVNFLLYNSKYNFKIYKQYETLTSDIKSVIFKKA